MLAAHRKAQPDDRDVLAWEVEVKWLDRDYAGVYQLLTGQRRQVFAQPMFRWKLEGYLVRSQIKLKRYDEAVREVEAQAKQKRADPLLRVLAQASQGGAKAAGAAMEKIRPHAYLLDRCYQDPDLGPLLRGEPFQEFRAKFPEPKTRGRGE